jgi:signal peptidase I
MIGHLRTAAAVISGFVVGLLLAATVLLASGPLTHTKTLTVLSGSMSPTIETGDAIIVRDAKPADLRVGDVITFRDPADRTRLITHRLRSLRLSGGMAHAVTKGDANTGTERWSMRADGEVAVVRHRLGHVGYVLEWMRSRPGRLALVVIPAILLCAFELRRIWKPARPLYVQLRLFD